MSCETACVLGVGRSSCPLSNLLTRVGPGRVLFYCKLREPQFLADTTFVIDTFHADTYRLHGNRKMVVCCWVIGSVVEKHDSVTVTPCDTGSLFPPYHDLLEGDEDFASVRQSLTFLNSSQWSRWSRGLYHVLFMLYFLNRRAGIGPSTLFSSCYLSSACHVSWSAGTGIFTWLCEVCWPTAHYIHREEN